MALPKTLLVGLTIAALLASAQALANEDLASLQSQPQALEAAFQAWMATHGRNYEPTTAIYASKFAAWNASVSTIVAHAANGQATYSLGLTAFADWTDEEFKATYLAAPAENKQDYPPFIDPSDYEHLPLPASWDWRQHKIVGPVKDQHVNNSKCGCCWAFATIAITEMVNAQYTGEVVTLSEQALIDCDRGGYDAGCDGGGYPTGVEYIIKHGITSDKEYPYVARDDTCNKKLASKVYVTLDEIRTLLPDNETLMAQVVTQTPLVTGVCCGSYIAEWRLYKGGVFNPGNCVKPIDHAVPIVGFGTDGGQDYWLIKNSWGYESFWSCSVAKPGYSGVATFVASPRFSPVDAAADCLPGEGNEDLNREGRIVQVDLGGLVVINVYVPNGGGSRDPENPRVDAKCRFLDALRTHADALVASGSRVLLVGDFNMAAGPNDVHPKAASYDAMYCERERRAFAALLSGYHDAWRERHPDTADVFTVWDEYTAARPFNHGVRIDYALYSPNMAEDVVDCQVLDMPPKWSDHTAVVIDIQDPPQAAKHPPCALSSAKRFPAPGASIKDMFAKAAKRKQEAQGGQGAQKAGEGKRLREGAAA